MHKVDPGQKCRILTIQIAVPADADPNSVADEMSAMLTSATAEEDSNILDWQYLDGPEHGVIISASEDPEEGEIFTLDRVSAQPHAFAVTAFGTSETLIKLQRMEVLLTSNQALQAICSLSETLAKCGKHGDLPARIILTLNGAQADTDFQEALDAGIAVYAI